jgi:arginase
MSTRYHIIEFPSNLGLKEPAPGVEPGVRNLPDWLRQWGFQEALQVTDPVNVPAPPFSMMMHTASGIRNAPAIASYTLKQAEALQPLLEKPGKILAIGGDCSILTGIGLALKQQGNYGLFTLDGHTDFMPASFSGTGGAAGMDLSIVTGHADDILANINNLGPYFSEENVFCAGNREMDTRYVGFIRQSQIRYLDLFEMRRLDAARVCDDWLRWVQQQQLNGFWLHLDVDVLDPRWMPAVDSPDPGGLSYDELSQWLSPLLASPLLTGLDITILDPSLDINGDITRRFIKEMLLLLQAPSGWQQS